MCGSRFSIMWLQEYFICVWSSSAVNKNKKSFIALYEGIFFFFCPFFLYFSSNSDLRFLDQSKPSSIFSQIDYKYQHKRTVCFRNIYSSLLLQRSILLAQNNFYSLKKTTRSKLLINVFGSFVNTFHV